MNRSRLIILTIAGAIACLVLSACGGSSAAGPTPTLSALDLAPLVLPVQQVVVDGQTLAFSGENSGQSEKSDILDGSFDRDRDSAELDQYGWRGAYDQEFRKAGDDGAGVFFAEASLSLSNSSDHAAQVVGVQMADLASDVGKTSIDSSGTNLALVSVTPFEPAITGAKGAVLKADVDGTVIYITGIVFARGPVVVSMSTAAYDERDLKAATEALARQLDTQVGTVIKP